MPHFAIRSRGDSRYAIWLADCTQEHAESVLLSVSQPAFTGPRDLYLEQAETLHDLPKRSWWKGLTRG